MSIRRFNMSNPNLAGASTQKRCAKCSSVLLEGKCLDCDHPKRQLDNPSGERIAVEQEEIAPESNVIAHGPENGTASNFQCNFSAEHLPTLTPKMAASRKKKRGGEETAIADVYILSEQCNAQILEDLASRRRAGHGSLQEVVPHSGGLLQIS